VVPCSISRPFAEHQDAISRLQQWPGGWPITIRRAGLSSLVGSRCRWASGRDEKGGGLIITSPRDCGWRPGHRQRCRSRRKIATWLRSPWPGSGSSAQQRLKAQVRNAPSMAWSSWASRRRFVRHICVNRRCLPEPHKALARVAIGNWRIVDAIEQDRPCCGCVQAAEQVGSRGFPAPVGRLRPHAHQRDLETQVAQDPIIGAVGKRTLFEVHTRRRWSAPGRMDGSKAALGLGQVADLNRFSFEELAVRSTAVGDRLIG